MADYNLSGSKNFIYFTDTSGSAIYDTGGPSGNHGDNENFYFGIYPAYATGTLTIKVTSFSSEINYDYLRIYNRIPPTASFNYNGASETGFLVKVLNGNPAVPITITASNGFAYLRWNSDTSVNNSGFRLEWTGSGIYTVDSSSNVPLNQYAVTFPKDATSGSYMTFEKGMLSSSSTLSADKDIIISFWGKFDPVSTDAVTRNILGIGNNGGHELRVSRVSSTNDLRLNFVDNVGAISSAPTATDILMGGGTFSSTANTYIPQWHHYGIVLNKISTTGSLGIFYRDGQRFSSGSFTKSGGWSFLTSSVDTVLASARTTGTTINTTNTWSGSLDDVFLATVITGSTASTYDTLFSNVFNMGKWSNPITTMSSSFTSSLNPTVVFNWRFEETGSLTGTKDYGSFGNYHSASSVTNITGRNVSLTSVESGISYTPYSSLEYSASAPAIEPGTFNWETTNVSVYETGSFATVNMIRTSGSYGNVTASIFFSSSQGTLTPPTGSGQVYFSASQTIAQVPFFILDDLIDEPDDPIYVTIPSFITDGGTAYTGSNGTLILTIIDNETGSISFTTGSDSVYENTSSYYVGVQRLYGGDQAQTASITFTGSAILNTNYKILYNSLEQTSPFNITWADQDNTTKYITASIFDNIGSNATKDVTFGIASSSISAIGPTASFQLNILDYEEGYASIQNPTYSIGEGDGFVNISVQRLSGSDGSLSIDYSTQDGTALSGTNYTYTNGTLTWGDGVTTNQAFQVPILYDGIQTANLNFKVNLSNLSTGSYSSYPTAITSSTVTITDQEPGTFRLSSSAYNVIEGQSVTVTVERYSGSYSTVNVNVRTDDDTAIQNVDYDPVNQNLTFSDSETLKTFTITTIENSTNITTPKFFTTYINSVNASDGTAFIGLPYIATVTIIDNESGSVRFPTFSHTGSQNSTITIPIERYNGGDFAATASVYVSSSSTAIAGVDYVNIFPYTLTWADQVSGSQNITITTLAPWNPSKTLNLYISGLTNITSGSIMSASVLIQSNTLTQSSSPLPNVSANYVTNDYANLSYQFTRRTQQVPFSLQKKGTGRLRKP